MDTAAITATQRSSVAGMGCEGPRARPAKERQTNPGGAVGLDCEFACSGGSLVVYRPIRSPGQIPCYRRRNDSDVSSLPGEVLRGRGRFWSACAVLQPGGAGVSFFRRLASGARGRKRRPVHRVSRLAQWKE